MESYAPSLLDKLLGAGAGAGQRDGVAWRLSAEQVKDSVAADIETMLNATRHFSGAELASFPHAARSLLTIGLIDISAMSLASDPDRQRITDAIRDGLTAHDRRLSNVEVGLRDFGPATGLTFTIRARLRLRPHAEQVVFDAVLRPGSKRYRVARSEARAPASTG